MAFHKAILDAVEVCGVVCMQREHMSPTPPPNISAHDLQNFVRHFEDRVIAEKKYFGDRTAQSVFTSTPVRYCTPASLNTAETASFVTSCAPDVVVIFGTMLIKDPVLAALPRDRVNLHLGLSPWYRGAATLFWPFYNMQPQYCGATIHQIVAAADAGAIIHQSLPVLEAGDGIHDVACKTVVQSSRDMVALLKKRVLDGSFEAHEQRSAGRLYREADFRPEHLRVIYDLFNNDMVDAYIRGDLTHEIPPVISGLSATA